MIIYIVLIYFLTNPTKDDINIVIKKGFKKLDEQINNYLNPSIKEIDINYKNCKFEITYMLNGKAKILIPKDEFKIIDIIV